MRRLTDPSEGDSIFNRERDMKIQEKLLLEQRGGHMPDENMNRTKYQVETLRQRSLKKPDEIFERTKRLNLQRLENESAYIASKGY